MKTTLELSDHVLHETKTYAAAHGVTMREVIEEALRRYLAAAGTAMPRRTLTIRPFAGGGFAPGYESRSWNDILAEVNERPAPGDEDGSR